MKQTQNIQEISEVLIFNIPEVPIILNLSELIGNYFYVILCIK